MTHVELPLEPPLRDCIAACETHCVAGCCGLEAFDFGDDNVRTWARSRTAGEVERARAQLASCIALARDENAWVSSDVLNAHTGEDGAFRATFVAALRALDVSLAAATPAAPA